VKNHTKGANLIQLVSPTPQLNKLKKEINMYNRNPKNSKDILENVVKWLKLNIKHKPVETDLITDNENLLSAIEDWKVNKYESV